MILETPNKNTNVNLNPLPDSYYLSYKSASYYLSYKPGTADDDTKKLDLKLRFFTQLVRSGYLSYNVINADNASTKTGALGEMLICDAIQGRLVNENGYDIILPDGRKFEVKTTVAVLGKSTLYFYGVESKKGKCKYLTFAYINGKNIRFSIIPHDVFFDTTTGAKLHCKDTKKNKFFCSSDPSNKAHPHNTAMMAKYQKYDGPHNLPMIGDMIDFDLLVKNGHVVINKELVGKLTGLYGEYRIRDLYTGKVVDESYDIIVIGENPFGLSVDTRIEVKTSWENDEQEFAFGNIISKKGKFDCMALVLLYADGTEKIYLIPHKDFYDHVQEKTNFVCTSNLTDDKSTIPFKNRDWLATFLINKQSGYTPHQ